VVNFEPVFKVPDNTPEIDADSSPDTPKVRLMTLGDLDGRTNAAKAARALIGELESDLGGADRLSAGERVIVGRAAVATAMIEDIEARWLSGRPLDVAAYCALVNVQRRLLTTVGLQRRPRDVTPDLAAYVAAKTVAPMPPPLPILPPLPPCAAV
jgi:hypothetical protein